MYLSVDIAPCDSTSLVASAYEVPLRTNTVDLVVSFDVLQHLQDYDKALDEMVRVLRPGGYAIVSVPFVYSECDVHDFRRWTMEGIVCELQKRCLAVELTRYRGGALFVVACWGVWAMQHLLPGQRRDWRSRKDAISILRAFLVVSLSVVPLMLAWCALAIDRVLPRSGSYMGVLVCARKRSA
jgi:SAM-dependent methyltransferase